RDRLNCLAFSRDGKTLASGCRDETIWLWGLTSGKPFCREIITAHGGNVNSLGFSPDSKLLVSANEDSTVKSWELGDEKASERLSRQPTRLNALSARFAPDG